MCKQFEIPSNLRDTKSSLVKKLSQMVEGLLMHERIKLRNERFKQLFW